MTWWSNCPDLLNKKNRNDAVTNLTEAEEYHEEVRMDRTPVEPQDDIEQ